MFSLRTAKNPPRDENQPENILVDAMGHLCLADMGLSKILGTGEDAVRTTTVCGTRAYLAPEMVLRKPYGMSVDFWQFGCFVYELYAVRPSEGGRQQQQQQQQQQQPTNESPAGVEGNTCGCSMSS